MRGSSGFCSIRCIIIGASFRFPPLNDAKEFLGANLPAPEPIPENLRDEHRAAVLLVDVEEFAYKEAPMFSAYPSGR